MKTLRLLTALVILLALTAALRAQDTWEWRSPSPTGNRLVSFAYGHGLFVGVGESGAIATSSDGATWTNRESGVFDSLTRVVFDGTRFVAVGGRAILVSSDGSAWTHQSSPVAVRDIVYGNGRFVAAIEGRQPADVAQFLVSSDGAAWTPLANPTTVSPSHFLFTNDIFVAVAVDGRALRSTDARSWTPVSIAPSGNNTGGTAPQSAAGAGVFLVSFAGKPYRSVDGLTWTSGLAWDEGLLFASQFSGPLRMGYLSNLGFAAGKFYLDEGRGGRGVFASPDGTTWTPVQPVTTNLMPSGYYLDLSTLASGSSIIVATENSIFTSGGYTNPHRTYIHYSTGGGLPAATGSTAFPFGPATDFAFTYGLGRFFARGLSSPDAQSWAACGFTPTHIAGDRLLRVTPRTAPVSPYVTVIVVELSTDGLTSREIDVRMPTPRAFAFGAGQYVAVGDQGTISTSPDAIVWTKVTSGTTKDLRAVLFAFNRFVAVGHDGALLTSPEGLNWSDRSTADLAGLALDGLAAGTDRLVVSSSVRSTISPSPIVLPDNIRICFAVDRDYRSPLFFDRAFLALTGSGSYLTRDAQLWRSTDGASWTEVPLHLSPQSHRTLASGNGLAVLFAGIGVGINDEVYPGVLVGTSAAAPTAPVITHPPVARTIRRGEPAAFAVGATGTGPFAYQWFHRNVAIAVATQSVLSLPLTTDADAGDYTVTVTNAVGSATSAVAHLTIDPPLPLAITRQPVGGALFEEVFLFLSIDVTGTGPVSYQWRRNGAPLANATSPTLALFGTQSIHANTVGTYDVVVTAPSSTITSAPVDVVWGGTDAHITPSGLVTRHVGESVTLAATVTGIGPFTYRWLRDGYGPNGAVALAGATSPTLTLAHLTPADGGGISLEVTDGSGRTTTFDAVNLLVNADYTVGSDPASVALEAGSTFTLGAAYFSANGGSYQWYRDGVAIPGATQSVLAFASFSAADAGAYTVTATLIYGNALNAALFPSIITSAPATLALKFSRLTNLSVRAFAGSDENTLISGFVLAGDSTNDLLVRSVGPGLKRFGLTGVIADPSVRVINGTHTLVAENDNWSTPLTIGIGAAATIDAMSQLGAFPLSPGSADSAVTLHATPPGLYMTQVSGASGTTGLALNEIYAGSSPAPRLVNLSARARVGSGDDLLIGGFVISGNQPLRVLIRGVGPTLAQQGVTAPLPHPKITLYDASGTALRSNDRWADAPNLAELRAATTATGAFALADGSNDAAMLETLAPGVYSVHVTSLDNSTGVALVEIYEAP